MRPIVVQSAIFLILSSSVAAPGAEASSSDANIETLLRQSQRAVLKSGETAKSEEDEPRASAPKPKRKKVAAAPVTKTPDLAHPDQTKEITDLKPIDTTAIEKVVSVDLAAMKREREPTYPISKLAVSAGLHQLAPVYDLMKDDDHFRDDTGGNLQGFSLAFYPVWKINALESRVGRTFLSAVIEAGFYQGNVAMRRTGIHPATSQFGVKLFPAQVGLQVEEELWRRVTVFAGYGPGLEVFHQEGSGVNDTVSQIFFGDQIWLGLSGRVSSSIQVFFRYQNKGTNLLLRSANYGGQVFAAGIMFGLFG